MTSNHSLRSPLFLLLLLFLFIFFWLLFFVFLCAVSSGKSGISGPMSILLFSFCRIVSWHFPLQFQNNPLPLLQEHWIGWFYKMQCLRVAWSVIAWQRFEGHCFLDKIRWFDFQFCMTWRWTIRSPSSLQRLTWQNDSFTRFTLFSAHSLFRYSTITVLVV